MNTAVVTDSAETLQWAGTPSQWQNWLPFLLCVLIVPIPWALWRYLVTRHTRYELTDQRLRLSHGVFSRVTEDVELYRVKDTRFEQSFWQRLVGLGDVVLTSSDPGEPQLRLADLHGAATVRETLRRLVEARRDAKRVREIDMH